MTTNNQMMQFINMLMRQSDPKTATLQLIQNQASKNPMFANLINLANNNRGQEIEMIARNVCRERGIDFDKEFNSFRQLLGL